MNLFNIIDALQLDKIDQEEFLKPAMRRGLFKKASEFSLKAALASLPFAMMAIPKIVKANGQDSAIDTLNFALTLEYLEREFYTLGVEASSLIPASDLAIFNQIKKHEEAHVTLLQGAITASGGTPVTKPTFDFTTPYPSVFTDYATFLTLSQAFEDTGVRAYKGQAGNLLGTDTLTVALQIHSVEARHAAEVRRLRGNKGWIVQSTANGVPSAVYGAGSPATDYPAESNTVQGGLDLTTLNLGFSTDNLTEAFDEPLDKATVTTIASLFIKS